MRMTEALLPVRRHTKARTTWPLCVLSSILLIGPTTAQARKLYPVDEGQRDPSFLAFRHRLIEAVKKHDLQFINKVLDKHVLSTLYGGQATKEVFKRTWESTTAEADLWNELLAILMLGGQFTNKREFCAPYVYTRFPDDLDDTVYEAIIGKNVPVRIRPSTTAPSVESLSYDLVKVHQEASMSPDSKPLGWVRVTTPSGQTGFVSTQYVRSPLDYRACFVKRHGRWWLTALVATD